MKERIRRVEILFKELGYQIEPEDDNEQGYSAAVFQGEEYLFGLTVDRESKFLELGFTFGFSPSLHDRIRSSMEDLLGICYEFGSYITFTADESEIALSVFTKIYFAGLNYYALKETVRDLYSTITMIKELFQLKDQLVGDDEYGNT
jgi:hypothetical protein